MEVTRLRGTDAHNHAPLKCYVHSDPVCDFTVRGTCLPRGPEPGEQNYTGNLTVAPGYLDVLQELEEGHDAVIE